MIVILHEKANERAKDRRHFFEVSKDHLIFITFRGLTREHQAHTQITTNNTTTNVLSAGHFKFTVS